MRTARHSTGPHELGQRNTLRGTKDPVNSSEVGVFYSAFCAAFSDLTVIDTAMGTRKRPHGLSSDKLLRVAVPSQLRGQLTRVADPEAVQECVDTCRKPFTE